MSDAQRIQAQLKQAIEMVQAGQSNAARHLLEEIVAVDPRQELAWMWLATVSADREERLRFLREVLMLNPRNSRAQDAYTQLAGEPFVPPDQPLSGEIAADEAGAIPERAGMRSFLPVLGVMIVVGIFAVVAFLVVLNPGDDEGGPTPIPSATFTARPTRGPTPTDTRTPFPTYTPGPSPTPLDWEAVPTWTLEPTITPAPTRTYLPSLTPRATRTSPPTRTAFPTDTPNAGSTP